MWSETRILFSFGPLVVERGALRTLTDAGRSARPTTLAQYPGTNALRNTQIVLQGNWSSLRVAALTARCRTTHLSHDLGDQFPTALPSNGESKW